MRATLKKSYTHPAGLAAANQGSMQVLPDGRVLAGRTASALAEAGSQRRAGFETMITVNSAGPYFAVAAEDASGRTLARSATVLLKK